MSHGKLRIEAQRLVQRTCGVDPEVVVETGNALIVVSLCLRIAGRHRIVDMANIVPKDDRKLQDVLWNITNCGICVSAMVVRRLSRCLCVCEPRRQEQTKKQGGFSHAAAV